MKEENDCEAVHASFINKSVFNRKWDMQEENYESYGNCEEN